MLETVDTPKGSNILWNTEWITYAWVMLISIWGGLVNYMNNGHKFSWPSLTAQILSSSFAGLLTSFACQYAGISGPLMGVLCGVAAHMGTPALIKLAMKLKLVRNLLSENGIKDDSVGNSSQPNQTV